MVKVLIQFAQIFNEEQIVAPLMRQLSWTHFLALIPIKRPTEKRKRNLKVKPQT